MPRKSKAEQIRTAAAILGQQGASKGGLTKTPAQVEARRRNAAKATTAKTLIPKSEHEAIRTAAAGGESQREIATRYGVSESLISLIVNEKSRKYKPIRMGTVYCGTDDELDPFNDTPDLPTEKELHQAVEEFKRDVVPVLVDSLLAHDWTHGPKHRFRRCSTCARLEWASPEGWILRNAEDAGTHGATCFEKENS